MANRSALIVARLVQNTCILLMTEAVLLIQQRLESVMGHGSSSQDEQPTFLDELTAAEGLERYLGAVPGEALH